ncbi:putative Histidine kinase [Candidatus Filomicrobium marinum]|uniref:histidine kinase n=1 Tax=Candidatus Filomicrobium marinum TaxID=1608628 RepID=A0A0D6JK99_9HYPH|nr:MULTISPECIES: ATP-binding protein [Filomicrobium]MCV0370772.1 response regulator [Filomicrobium sp.]CFX30488.1 putative Histidine kinase [Candidatus Filomicrobium marinum]CPR22080.1 putative Histidine kinase [Candidatus Filomicrobium marinum]
MLNSPMEASYLRSPTGQASVRRRKPAIGLAAKVLAPITGLTLLAATLGGLILNEEYKVYQSSVAQKKAELTWRVRTLYEGNRSKLLDVAKLLANNPSVQNGLLIGDQYNPLNTIMNFLGHSSIDIINLYDLDGRAFARAQSPSYFGDYDEFAPIVREIVAGTASEEPKTVSGIAPYKDGLALVAIRVTQGVSGATGVVVVGQRLSPQFLQSFAPANHTSVALYQSGKSFMWTDDVSAFPADEGAHTAYTERAVAGGAPYRIELVTNDLALFGPFWGARASILSIAAIAAAASVIVTFIFMFMTVVRPVRHLIAVAEKQVSGDLTARVHLRSQDELGRLGDILNLLTGNLRASLAERDRTNEQLEARVERRTEQLQRELVERERAQAELVRAKEEAEAANASKSRFLAAASHDLRQPVHAMTLFVSNLVQQVESPKAKQTVINVNACVETLCEMFENILDVSKLASGVIKPETEEFPVSRLLDRLQREFEGLAAEKGVDLKSIRSTLLVRSDPALLYRILSNLLSNAIKNTKEGRVLIGCRSRGDSVEIQIWDTGIGIPQSEIVHIFEEFYRGANKPDHRGGVGFGSGLGLGLSIVEHTARLLNHAVHVASVPNKHTRFSITLPRAAGTPPARQNPTANKHLDVAGALVLVVDDDVLALKAVQSTLEDWGCTVITAQTSDDALAILAAGDPLQAIIVDYLLQNDDTGVNLLRKMEDELGLRIPAIILSGVSSRLLEQEAERNGYKLLYKPTQPLRLRQALASSVLAGHTVADMPVRRAVD